MSDNPTRNELLATAALQAASTLLTGNNAVDHNRTMEVADKFLSWLKQNS